MGRLRRERRGREPRPRSRRSPGPLRLRTLRAGRPARGRAPVAAVRARPATRGVPPASPPAVAVPSVARSHHGRCPLTGTWAARIHFTDKPADGSNGDHVNESFFTISPAGRNYSELDNEYEPNGGWGAPGPRLDNATWRSAAQDDRVAGERLISLQGWHTVMMTAARGRVDYSVDGRLVFQNSGGSYPRKAMSTDFNDWFVDLPFTGARSWDTQVDWFYYDSGHARTLTQVDRAVPGLAANGSVHVDTVHTPT